MAACVPTLRPLFHRTWDRTQSGPGYSGSRSVDATGTTSTLRPRKAHERGSSHTDAGVCLAHVGKEYAESAESRQGIMRTMEVCVEQGCGDERPLSRSHEVVPMSLKDSQR